MARIAGISTQKDHKGKIVKVTIDLRKHRAAIEPFLQQIGAIEEDEFDKAVKEGYTIEEARQEIYKRMDKWLKS
jgi:hypothetical protein